MKELDFKVIVDLSGLSIAESVLDKGPIDRNSIKKRIDSDGTPRYTLKMTGTTIAKTSVNGLFLSEPELDNMVAGPFVQKRLKNNALYCEMNHPASKDPLVLRSINQNNLSHRILEFFKEQQGDYKALCFIMETTKQQAGKNLAYMIEDDASIAVSLRAHATAMRAPNGEIMKNIHYTSYDAVWIPSNEASWSGLPSKMNMQIAESINTDLAHAMGATVEDITKFKMNSLMHLEELNKKNIKRINLLESYLINGGDGCKIIDLGSKGNTSIQESIMNISESAGIDFGTGEHDYIIINESLGTAIFANGEIRAEAKLAKSMISDIMQSTKKKLFL